MMPSRGSTTQSVVIAGSGRTGSRVSPGSFETEHEAALDDAFRKVTTPTSVAVAGRPRSSHTFVGGCTVPSPRPAGRANPPPPHCPISGLANGMLAEPDLTASDDYGPPGPRSSPLRSPQPELVLPQRLAMHRHPEDIFRRREPGHLAGAEHYRKLQPPSWIQIARERPVTTVPGACSGFAGRPLLWR